MTRLRRPRRGSHVQHRRDPPPTAEGFDHEREWVRNLWFALQPWHTSVYVNFLVEEGPGPHPQRLRADKYGRLKALKRKYDPDNFFRLNQNIPPD